MRTIRNAVVEKNGKLRPIDANHPMTVGGILGLGPGREFAVRGSFEMAGSKVFLAVPSKVGGLNEAVVCGEVGGSSRDFIIADSEGQDNFVYKSGLFSSGWWWTGHLDVPSVELLSCRSLADLVRGPQRREQPGTPGQPGAPGRLELANVQVAKDGSLIPKDPREPMEVGPLRFKPDGNFGLDLAAHPKPLVQERGPAIFVRQKEAGSGKGLVLIIVNGMIVVSTDSSTDLFRMTESDGSVIWKWTDHKDEVDESFFSLESIDDFLRKFKQS